jgi:hypothetical protein
MNGSPVFDRHKLMKKKQFSFTAEEELISMIQFIERIENKQVTFVKTIFN